MNSALPPPGSTAHAGTDDIVAARQDLARALGDDAAMAALRANAPAANDGMAASRLDDHQILDDLAAAAAAGRGRSTRAGPALRAMVPAEARAPAPRPPSSLPSRAAAPRAAAAAPPPAAATTFGSGLDVAAMVAVLVQAAQDGVPFCEECARAAAEAAA